MATTDSKVVNHLLFHKALIDEEDDGERLNEYLDLVEEADSGEHVSIQDPFDRAISVAFELVIDEHLDPWRIDLVRFSSMYLDRVREADDLNLVTAGRLVFMAWRILRMQSEELRDQADPPPEPEPEWDTGWDDLEFGDWLTDDADYEYTNRVKESEDPPIDEKVRRKGDRKVTLYELVGALEEARRESELRQLLNEKRAEEREARKQDRVEPGSVTHEEDQEADIARVWNRINRFNGHPIPITSLRDQAKRDDVVTTFTSILFLAREERVKVWQEEFPYGMIYVRNLTLDGKGTPTDVQPADGEDPREVPDAGEADDGPEGSDVPANATEGTA